MTLLSDSPASVSSDPAGVATRWLGEFERASSAGDRVALEALFTSDATWRDQVSFSWSITNWEGDARVAEAFIAADRKATGFRLKTGTQPTLADLGAGDRVTAIFDFRNVYGVGSGVVQLAPAENGIGWAAEHLMTQLDELADHGWQVDERRPIGRGHGGIIDRPDPAETWAEAIAFENREPEVVVLGAGHNGLMIGARLERLGVDTLIIDRNERVGDVWRKRYPALALHNITEVNDFPFFPFPRSFPRYLPKEQLADFMEYYAKAMELKVWGDSGIEKATYDEKSKRWTVTVRRGDGSTRDLHPAHLVLATGLNGNPRIPEFPGQEEFSGTVAHSGDFTGGREWKGKKVVVVGAGVSAHDIAQDLYEHGADITLVQRSSTYIVNVDTFHKYFYADYLVPGVSTEIADITSSMIPLGVLRRRGGLKFATDLMADDDKQLLDDLKARGFAFDFRDNGNGVAEGHHSGRDSYYFDIGASRLIADGEITFTSGHGVERFTENGVVLDDGTELEADHVVLATGYTSMLDAVRPIIGDEVADRIGTVWRWGDDDEISNVWHKTAQPGLWFMTGTIRDSRIGSKALALQIKAIQEGLDSFPEAG